MRTGAALVTLAARGARAALDAKVVEMMTAEIPEALEASVGAALAEASSRDTCVLGPGVGVDAGARAYLERLALALPLPTVLDADALTAFAGRAGALKSAVAPRVLTPHPGEAAQLLGAETRAVQANRFAAATTLADAAGAVVVLKGARTVIAAPNVALEVITEGTPALASGGTGDVLAGIIAARLVHAPPRLAARQGVLLHALAGMRAARADRGLLAHEVADAVPDVIAGG
jgi:NAD(P)H-hydrate epimerase